MPQPQRLRIMDFMLALLILISLITGGSLQRPGVLSLFLRKARYYPTSITGLYQADLRYCDFPDDTSTVRGSYFVNLHWSCSFNELKPTIEEKADLDTKISCGGPENLDGSHHEVFEDVDDELLADIRADMKVYYVECINLAEIVDMEPMDPSRPGAMTPVRTYYVTRGAGGF